MDPAVTSALVGGGFDIAGTAFGNRAARKEGHKARVWDEHTRKMGHIWNRKALEAANLNPMLAVGQANPTGTSAQAMQQGFDSSGILKGAQSSVAKEQSKLTKEKTSTEKKAQEKLSADTELARSNTALSQSQEEAMAGQIAASRRDQKLYDSPIGIPLRMFEKVAAGIGGSAAGLGMLLKGLHSRPEKSMKIIKHKK